MDYKEKVIALLNSKELTKEQREKLKEIFPELAESDDERIRKAIHIYLDWLDGRNKDYQPKGDYSIKDMIAWLEKQKEYESTDFEYVWDRTDCGALTSALDKYSKEAIINMCHAWYDKGIELERKSWLEKQGEPMEINPTEFDTRLQTLIGKFDNLPKEELIGSLSFWMNVVQNDGTYKPDKKQSEQNTF